MFQRFFQGLGKREEMQKPVFSLEQDRDRAVLIRNEIKFLLAASPDDEQGVLHWIDRYGSAFKILVEADPSILQRFAEASETERNGILDEVRHKLYH